MSLGTKFYFKQSILFAPKGYFWSKKEKVNITIEFFIFELFLVPKFQPKLALLSFWIKFAQKGYFHSDTEKVKTTIEFGILELI